MGSFCFEEIKEDPQFSQAVHGLVEKSRKKATSCWGFSLAVGSLVLTDRGMEVQKNVVIPDPLGSSECIHTCATDGHQSPVPGSFLTRTLSPANKLLISTVPRGGPSSRAPQEGCQVINGAQAALRLGKWLSSLIAFRWWSQT